MTKEPLPVPDRVAMALAALDSLSDAEFEERFLPAVEERRAKIARGTCTKAVPIRRVRCPEGFRMPARARAVDPV